MDANQVARDNHAFYYVAVAMAMCDDLFASAVVNSFDEPAQYGVPMDGRLGGYIRVNSIDIKHQCSPKILANLLDRLVMKIPDAITGKMNTDVVLVDGYFKFSFKITKYERGGEHNFEMVDDPLPLPDGEQLGRFVDLKITIHPPG